MNVGDIIRLLKKYPREVPVYVSGDWKLEEMKRALDVIYLKYESGNRYVVINASPDAFTHLLKGDAE